MSRLDFELFSLEKQKPTKTEYAYLELNHDHMYYRLNFLAEEWVNPEDEMLGTKEVLNYFDTMVMKANIAAIELCFTTDEYWRILIAVSGIGEDLKIFFQKKETAEKMRKELIEWKLKK